MEKNIIKSLTPIVFIGVISFATFLIIFEMHPFDNWERIIEASNGVMDRTPHWVTYQNRLLMPYLIHLLQLYGLSDLNSILFFFFMGIFLQNILLKYCISSIFSSHWSWVAIVVWSFLFCIFQHYWLYPWDIFDILIATFIAFILVTKKHGFYLLALFPLAILNRESGLFLPIAFLIFTFQKELESNSLELRKLFWSFIISGLLILIGILWILYIREALFIGSNLSDESIEGIVMGNHIKIVTNLKLFFISNWQSKHIIHNIFIIIFSYGFLLTFLKEKYKLLAPVGVMYFIIFFSNLVFGSFNETRIHFPLISLYVFFLIYYLRINFSLTKNRG